jgi:hypothetical protein
MASSGRQGKQQDPLLLSFRSPRGMAAQGAFSPPSDPVPPAAPGWRWRRSKDGMAQQHPLERIHLAPLRRLSDSLERLVETQLWVRVMIGPFPSPAGWLFPACCS